MFAGIDTHKDTLTAAVADQAGRLLVELEVRNTRVGFVGRVKLFKTRQAATHADTSTATHQLPRAAASAQRRRTFEESHQTCPTRWPVLVSPCLLPR